MSNQYSVKIEGLDKLDFAHAPEHVRKNVTDAMNKSVITVVSEVRPLTPVGVSSRLRNSIGSKVETTQSSVIGRVGSSLKGEEYPAVMELGRKPDSTPPPVDSLIRWVHIRLGVSNEEARRAAFAVARSIGKKGIKARAYLKRGLEASRTKIQTYFDEALHQLGKDLTNGS